VVSSRSTPPQLTTIWVVRTSTCASLTNCQYTCNAPSPNRCERHWCPLGCSNLARNRLPLERVGLYTSITCGHFDSPCGDRFRSTIDPVETRDSKVDRSGVHEIVPRRWFDIVISPRMPNTSVTSSTAGSRTGRPTDDAVASVVVIPSEDSLKKAQEILLPSLALLSTGYASFLCPSLYSWSCADNQSTVSRLLVVS